MVNAVGIEIFCHFAEALLPPFVVVFFHYPPVVGGKAPVLSVGREVIGWGACLSVQVEVFGFHPCLHPIPADADGNIPLEYHPVGTGIVVCLFHLLVQAELHKGPKGDVLSHGTLVDVYCLAFSALSWHAAYGVLGGIYGHFFLPLVKAGGAVLLPVVAEHGIRQQPFAVVGFKVVVFFRLQHVLFLLAQQLLVQVAQICHLVLAHLFIVYLWQFVQLLLQLLVLASFLGVFQCWQLSQVNVLWMQGIDADAVVWIGVLPGVCDDGVVDGQHLYHPHAGGLCPVHHFLQVAEVAHPKAAL